nr:alpha/beta hydrolase [Lebetimonas natsushimae]
MNFSLFFFLLLFLTACLNIPTPEQRFHTAENLAVNMNKKIYHTKYFDIFSYQKISGNCKDIHVYIEGDGLSWVTSTTISSNPTPINPLALKLATKDDNKCVIYLARPCQYINSTNCNYKYWTSARFAPEVIKTYMRVLNKIKSEYQNNKFTLFGFSGGGTVATILAAKRDDINLLVTISGNLDIQKWCELHHISKLKYSLNPADFTKSLQNVKQFHLIGGQDYNTGEKVFFSFYNKFSNRSMIKYKIYPNFTHSYGWYEKWNEILKEINNGNN